MYVNSKFVKITKISIFLAIFYKSISFGESHSELDSESPKRKIVSAFAEIRFCYTRCRPHRNAIKRLLRSPALQVFAKAGFRYALTIFIVLQKNYRT